VEILLGMEGIKPDMEDRYGLTPLEWACRINSVAVVRMLLKRNDVNLHLRRYTRVGPLTWATECRDDDEIPRMLRRAGAAGGVGRLMGVRHQRKIWDVDLRLWV